MVDKEMKKKAKMEMLKHLRDMMHDDMNEGMKEGLKKVTVMSDSEKGLEKGLSKAQEIMRKREEETEEGDCYTCGGAKSSKQKSLKEFLKK